MAIDYLPRLVDEQLARALRTTGAVVLEGPKARGKTSTAGQQAASTARLDADPRIRTAALTDATIVLPGATPRLIDDGSSCPTSGTPCGPRSTRGKLTVSSSSRDPPRRATT